MRNEKLNSAGVDSIRNSIATNMGNPRRLHTTVYRIELKDHWADAQTDPSKPKFEYAMAQADWNGLRKEFEITELRFRPKTERVPQSDVVSPMMLRSGHLFTMSAQPLETINAARAGFAANRLRLWSRDIAPKAFTEACQGEGKAHSINVDTYEDITSGGPGSGGVSEIIGTLGGWLGGRKTANASNFISVDFD